MTDAPAPPRDYRDTVRLPRTSFPLRGDLPRREPLRLDRWRAEGLRQAIRRDSAGRPPFVLHDGPPYANGPLHIGHALNKILKDAINRAAQMSGRDADYVPGWDCHGLPIEWKVEEGYRARRQDKDAVPVLEFRAECRAYAEHWLGVQREEFERLGVLGDWDGRYATMDFASEAAIAAEIGRFLESGALFRGLRPVLWSPTERTALAEAEIEYQDVVSPTLHAAFPLVSAPSPDLLGARAVIWTTTPWTIPANRALAYGPGIPYALARVEAVAEGALVVPGQTLLVAEARLPDLLAAAGITAHAVLRTLPGSALEGAVAAHPLRGWPGGAGGHGHDAPLLPGEFVTDAAGTGLVHLAPAHGEDDFALARAHGLPVPEAVADDGTYTAQAPGFEGTHVFRAHGPVWAALEAMGTLVAKGELRHSYPHSWRSKKPVIYRATPQWFIAMDGPHAIRERALAALETTRFVPEAGRNRLTGMIAARPDWCVSRQRAWGVPIPVFVERRTGEPLRDPAVTERVVAAFREEGADAWYRPGAAARFLGNGRDPAEYEQVMDIVDVWFESGSTHAFVLRDRGLPRPADLYLEGSDQHRGWFHSSLLESVGTTGEAPFRALLTHGFTLDEGGRKMSKSLGNVTAPQAVVAEHGADVLRLWVMNTDFTEDQRIGPAILGQQAELYRRLRNTLRWLLGNLDGFEEAERLPLAELPELERWVLHRLHGLDARLRRAVETHDWAGVYPEIHAFCAADLSAFYFDVRKDSLYCDAPASQRRRAARTVLDHLMRCLTLWLAPVLVFTAEEAWRARHGEDAPSVHRQSFPEVPEAWGDAALAGRWERVREVRRAATAALEAERGSGRLGASLQAAVVLPAEAEAILPAAEWEALLIVSAVAFGEALAVSRAPGAKCERCWRVLPEVGASPAHPGLCRRCEAVVDGAA